ACAGACASGSNCPMHLSYTSDSYSGNSIALYLDNGGCGGGSNSTATAVQSGDSWGGGSVSMQGFN
ncbi:MAG TPA: hypothetical protein VJ728_09370, partial [Candidatus Binataceae bacterium]|nr:hypothetical protein [Candidatus Binataceae bacterium]